MRNLIFTFFFFCFLISSSVAQNASITGTVWKESDLNATLEGEQGVNGVIVFLIDADSGEYVDSAITANLEFNFPSDDNGVLLPGNYYLEIATESVGAGSILQNFISCPGSNDANDGVDNDDNGEDNYPVQSSIFSVDTGHIEYIDFCFYSDCNEEIIFATESCDEISSTDIFCSVSALDKLCGLMKTTNSQGNQPQPLCFDGGAAHNISWFAFVANDGNYSITVTPTGCFGSTTGTEGVQMGLYTDCTFTESVYCEPTCSLNPLTIESDLLTPGQTYYFFIDGCSGSVCSYEVGVSGTLLPPEIEVEELCIFENGNILCDDLTTCKDNGVLFVANSSDISATYDWQITTLSGGPYVGDPNPESDKNSIVIPFTNEGVYSICLTNITNPCMVLDWNGNVCRTVTIAGIDDEAFNTIDLCEDELLNFDITVLDDQDPNQDGISGWQDSNSNFDFGYNESFITDTNNCMYTQELFINPIENPMISLTPNSNLLCLGEALNFTLSTNAIYDSIIWVINDVQQTDSVGVLFPEVGEYTFMTTIYSECGTDSDETTVQILDTISAPNVTCDTSNIGMIILFWPEVEGVEGYWLSINEDSSIVVTDSFYVIENLEQGEEVNIEFNLLDSTKCVGPNIELSCIAATIVGIEEQSEYQIEIVPNPTHDYLVIKTPLALSEAKYFVYSIKGELFISGNIDESMKVDVSNLPEGLYIIAVREEHDKVSRYGRFVKI